MTNGKSRGGLNFRQVCVEDMKALLGVGVRYCVTWGNMSQRMR